MTGPGKNAPAPHQVLAQAVLAAVALHRLTGAETYRSHAVDFADRLLGCQETQFVGRSRVTGFFYEAEDRSRILHEQHTSFADAPARAFGALCDLLPDHPRWIDWYAAIAFESTSLLSEGARASSPFEYLPSGVWTEQDFDRFETDTIAHLRHTPAGITDRLIPEPDATQIRSALRAEFDAGHDLGGGARLRVFPIPSDPVVHGGTTIQLAQTIVLAEAARIRGDLQLQDLASLQLEWVFGRNPFSSSLMYGAGYDYMDQFQMIARDMVGAVPVGMNNRLDRPLWPTSTHFTYKEVWVVTGAKLLVCLGQAIDIVELSLRAPAGAEFRNIRTDTLIVAIPGDSKIKIPAGEYEIIFGGRRIRRRFVRGSQHRLSLDPISFVEVSCKLTPNHNGELNVSVTGTGPGRSQLRLRSVNVSGVKDETSTFIDDRHPLEWQLSIIDQAHAWIVVVDVIGPNPRRFEFDDRTISRSSFFELTERAPAQAGPTLPVH